jgi:tetratricopeptide (TPR) repeat protein
MTRKIAAALFLAWLVSTGYIAGFATASIFYMANVLAHVAGGAVLLAAGWRILPARARWPAAAAGVTGAWLVWQGALTPQLPALWLHIAVGVAALVLMMGLGRAYRLAFGAALILGLGGQAWYGFVPNPANRISNSLVVPGSMREEGAGPDSPFWPSAANTNVNGTIPADFFMDSELCGSCHKDIYEQWQSSMHHFASFNNQFYRKSVEHMQELSGTKGSKWCAGCHDHAMFFNGRFDRPAKEQLDTPEAHTGLGCVSCHSIVQVNGTAGNGGIIIEYPPLHELASSRNKYIRMLDRFLTNLDPEPHRRTFLKPFMRLDSAEFCSACHKVHLDAPVNNYRWLRGFNDYDNWQASGVSGHGARSFYYPPKPSTCVECHMPLVASRDPGNRGGKVHSHRFAAANTAVPTANRDQKQLQEVKDFLQSGIISVDVFAAAPVTDNGKELAMQRRAESVPQLSSTFAVGEEAETGGAYVIREVGKLAAPLNHPEVTLKPDSTVRLDVVVRTRKVGHFFPGGTVDAFDVWLEVTGKDAAGRVFFQSGNVAEEGRGPVEKGAHFYRSFLLDAEGNHINKRNAWQARSSLYVRLIPPGAADVAHYRIRIPKDVQGPLTFEAKLNYRKFSHYYTQYVYAGKAGAGSAGIHHDSRAYSFLPVNIPSNVSGKIRGAIPELPIVTIAEHKVAISASRDEPDWKPRVARADRERWNDWGIGLLLQGDLRGAEWAFHRVTEAEPEYADGWLNIARSLIQEGQTAAARPFLERARRAGPDLARVDFFAALVEKADGNYDQALALLARAAEKYPRDRVVLNQMGRVQFLRRDYKAAAATLERVIAIDPEDVQAHYNLMLAWRGLGDREKAEREEKLFLRFKADEAAQTITSKPRLLSPEDNNERQMIHDHESSQ